MGVLQRLIGMALRPRAQKRARGRSFEDLATSLAVSREPIEARIATAKDSARNREALNHIVGIERWGQRRVREVLGEPFEADGHHGYRLADGATMAELRDAFASTRDDTVALARTLSRSAVDPTRTVRHADLGELTVLEWLAYLEDHASRERWRIRTH